MGDQPGRMTDLPLCTCDHPEAAHICHFDHNECFICGCREFRTPTPTDLPDAVVQLTDDEIKALAEVASGVSPRKRPGDWEYSFPHDALLAAVESIITDRLATASGPWAEQLDAEPPSALDERLTNLLAVCDAYARGDELTRQQIDRFHNLADMSTVRWLIRTARGMTSHRDTLQQRLDAALARNAELEKQGTKLADGLHAWRDQALLAESRVTPTAPTTDAPEREVIDVSDESGLTATSGTCPTCGAPTSSLDAVAGGGSPSAVLEGSHVGESSEKAETKQSDAEIFCAERDALRAELDSLRDRVNALADEGFTDQRGDYYQAVWSDDLRAALVRGSEDE